MRPFLENIPPPDREIVLHNLDRRKPVEDTQPYPFRWICSIEVEFGEPVVNPLGILETPGAKWKDLPTGTKGCGSGLLISQRQVLTCSHVLMGLRLHRSAASGKLALFPVLPKRVTVIPGRNEAKVFGAKPFGSWKAEAVRVNATFQQKTTGLAEALTVERLRQALPFDFAVVEVKKKYAAGLARKIFPGEKIGWWRSEMGCLFQPVEGAFREKLGSRKVNICGYPGEKGNIPCGLPYLSSDQVATSFPNIGGKVQDLLFYRADTSAGMSGSPVWIKNDDGKRFLVAVHSSFQEYRDDRTGRLGRANLGVLATGGMVGQLRRWGVQV